MVKDSGVPPRAGPGFLHGVGSFDPTPHAVIIWTRLTPVSAADVVAVDWQVSERSDFGSLVASGTHATDASRDFTVAVDVDGLRPGTHYHYRFSSGKLHSVAGRTKTAPEGHLESLIFATVCCANWGFGYFHVYDLLSRVDDLDMVVHVGDYVYEYAKRDYPGVEALARHGLRPKHHCKTLDDYRQRYACYRGDPALQELHRRVPMIAVNDDHEVHDSAYQQGAEDFEGTKAEWEQRKHAGIQAYVEWVPVRGMNHDKLDISAIHRTFQYGDLMTLMLVENRLTNRMPPVDIKQTDFYKLTAQTDLKEWKDDKIRLAADAFMAELADPNRTMIGKKQVADVQQAVQDSVAAGQPWQVLISQTVFSPLKAPKLLATVDLQPKALSWVCRKALKTATSESRAGKDGAEQARMYLGMGRFGVPMNPDAYDGYAAERAQLLEVLNAPGANPVVMAGDSHNAWAHEIVGSDGRRLGVEFDAPAVTSPGAFEDIYLQFKAKLGVLARLFPLYLFTPWIEDSLAAANPATLQWCNLDRKGFVLYHVTRGKFHAEFHMVSSIEKKAYSNYCSAVFDTEADHKGRLSRGFRYLTIDGQIPQRDQPKRSAFLRAARAISKQAW